MSEQITAEELAERRRILRESHLESLDHLRKEVEADHIDGMILVATGPGGRTFSGGCVMEHAIPALTGLIFMELLRVGLQGRALLEALLAASGADPA